MDPPCPPMSPKEYVERIKDGKFEFAKHGLNDDGSWRVDEPDQNNPFAVYNVSGYILWVDPDHPKDAEGYTAAEKLMEKALKDAERMIAVSNPAEGLAALEKFEAETFH